MRRVLFATVVLVMLLGSFSSVFAAEPVVVDQQEAILGQVWWFYADFGTPGMRVDAYMYRPATAVWDPLFMEWVPLGWPFAWGPNVGTFWWGEPAADGLVYIDPPETAGLITLNDSEMRRMSYAEDWLYTDPWGWYYAEFMFPRDEVWYPCSFPLKWKCDYLLDPGSPVDPPIFEVHSPAAMVYECYWDGPFLFCLDWPWAFDPMDTVSPLQVVILDIFGFGYVWEFEVLGMFWKFSDIE